MDLKPDQFPKRQEDSSILDTMVLKPDVLEKLLSTEEIRAEIRQAVISGKSEASELIREAGLVEKIQEANILFLNRELVQTYLKVLKFQNNQEYTKYDELDRVGGMYDPVTKKIGILVDPSELSEKHTFTQANIFSIAAHEILHKLAQNIKITWLNEAITERLTQGLIRDTLSSSEQLNTVFAALSEDENDKISFNSYKRERNQLLELSEEILDTCSPYVNLSKENYRERSWSESKVFRENFGKAYFTGDLSTLKNNIRELGYSSVSELEQLDPSASA